MIRTPLRPLARVLHARAKGENPDLIERENIRLRHEEMQDRSRARAEGRSRASQPGRIPGVRQRCRETEVLTRTVGRIGGGSGGQRPPKNPPINLIPLGC